MSEVLCYKEKRCTEEIEGHDVKDAEEEAKCESRNAENR